MEEVKVVSFANQKGGVGKSTLTVMAANYLASKGLKVLVVDSDYQGSILALRKMDEAELGRDYKFNYDVKFCLPKDLEVLMDEYEDKYDIMFIDMPGQSYGDGLSKLLTLLDYAFIPVKTGDTDVHSSMDFMENIYVASDIREKCDLPPLKYHLVINEAEPKTIRFKNLLEFMKMKGYFYNENLVVKKKVSIKDLSNTYINPVEDKDGEDLKPFLEEIKRLLEINA